MDKKKTGNLIKEARIKKGYTQQELGDMVGVTNKAISRWENGEAFPDVSLLDTLSFTLDLDINEIVLGEKKEEADNAVALEMVQIARMEKNRKARQFYIRCIIFAIFAFLFVCGIRTIAYGLYEWPVQILYYGCAIAVLAIGFIKVKRRSSSFRAGGRLSTVTAIISGFSVVYSIVLVCGTMTLMVRGIILLGFKDAQIGPFINYQLLFIFFINVISGLYFIIAVFEKEKDISIGLYTSIAGVFLSMVYSDLLHRLISPEDFYLIFIIDTAVILGIIFVGIVLAWAIVYKIVRISVK